MDFDLLLLDRIHTIRTINEKYDLLSNSYLSFSGGKDSTILHCLLDIALPNNSIPRVFIDTGIEYNKIREFVMGMAKFDSRFVILKPSQNIKKVLEEYGYPFKSKEHSQYVHVFQKCGYTKTTERYLNPSPERVRFGCPDFLKYQFSKDFTLPISDFCCLKLKKEPSIRWQIENNKSIVLTGMRKQEGGNRSHIGCVVTDKDGNLKKFHPLLVVDDDFERTFIKRYNILLCELYYPPFNFSRTGCKGCPFNPSLQRDLDLMSIYLNNEYKQCELIWKPVYDEYRRLSYRLYHY